MKIHGTENPIKNFLLDSGAAISVLKVNSLHDETIVNFSSIEVKGITSEPIKTLGIVTLEIETPEIQNKPYHITFHIVPSNFPISQDGIIGNNFLKQTNAVIDYGRSQGTFILKETPVSIKFQTANVNIVIPPRVEKIVKYGPVSIQEESIALFNSDKLSKSGLFVSNSIVKPQNGFVFLSILNSNSFPISIDNDLEVKFTAINDYSVYSLTESPFNSTVENRLSILEKQMDLNHLNAEERQAIIEMCRDYNHLFYVGGDKLSATDAVTHQINTDPAKPPVNIRPYRLAQIHKTEIKEQVDKMISEGIVCPSASPWNSPLLVVPKKSDSEGQKKWRVVVDFRKLNENTIPDAYPLPNIEDILGQLGNSKYFSTLDLANGFHQIMVDERDKPKTAFSTCQGHYEFNRMPFGLRNAPPTFQRLMNKVLTGLIGNRCLVYLDDIIVYGANLKKHNSRLLEVFQMLSKFNLKLQPNKCKFLNKEVMYLGHVISEKRSSPDPNKVSAIDKILPPRNVDQVRSFLGFVGYYRKFIMNFSKFSAPLNRLLKKDSVFKWDAFCAKRSTI